MQKNKLSMGYYIKKSVLARSFRHKGEGHMNWRTRCTKYSPTCPLVFTSGKTYRTVLTTGRDENTSCPVGTEYTITSEDAGPNSPSLNLAGKSGLVHSTN